MNATAAAWASWSDERLADSFVRGERVCFDEIVRRHSVPIYSFIFGMVGRPEDAEDLIPPRTVSLHSRVASIDKPQLMRVNVIFRNNSQQFFADTFGLVDILRTNRVLVIVRHWVSHSCKESKLLTPITDAWA